MKDTDPQDTLLTPYEGRSILAVPIALLIAIPLYRVVGSLAGGLSLAGIFSVWWLAIPAWECQEFCVRDGFDSSCPAAAEQEESAHRAIAGMKRSVYRMANWFIAGFQYSIGFSIQP